MNWIGESDDSRSDVLARATSAMQAIMDALHTFGIFCSDEPPPSYPTKPIPGVELGGTQRNPEDNVLDEIDKLVDWQLENGGQW